MVTPSPTLALNETVARLRRQGHDVVSFGAGAPKLPPPRPALSALEKIDVENCSGYGATCGEHELRVALARFYDAAFERNSTEQDFLITVGAKQALVITLLTLCDVGDKVAVPAPYWPSYVDIAKLLGLKLIPLPAQPSANANVQGWVSSMPEDARVLLYSSPSNPDGSVIGDDELDYLSTWALKTNRWIIADEIYQFQFFGGRLAAPSVLDITDARQCRLVHVSSASKTYSLMGHRIGWIVATPEVISRCAGIASNLAGNVNRAGQILVAETVRETSCEELMQRSEILARQRDTLWEGLRHVSWLKPLRKPDGGLFIWCEIDGTDAVDSTTLARALLDEVHVAVVPGVIFGKNDALRFSFTESQSDISKGIARLTAWRTG